MSVLYLPAGTLNHWQRTTPCSTARIVRLAGYRPTSIIGCRAKRAGSILSWLRWGSIGPAQFIQGLISKPMQSRLIRANRLFAKIAFAVVVTVALVLSAWYCRGRFPQATYSAKSENPAPRTDWSNYSGGPTGDHYSPLDQITAANVSHLKQVWRFDSGTDGGVQTNSLVVDALSTATALPCR